jgi:hypothetical protein
MIKPKDIQERLLCSDYTLEFVSMSINYKHKVDRHIDELVYLSSYKFNSALQKWIPRHIEAYKDVRVNASISYIVLSVNALIMTNENYSKKDISKIQEFMQNICNKLLEKDFYTDSIKNRIVIFLPSMKRLSLEDKNISILLNHYEGNTFNLIVNSRYKIEKYF